MCGELDDETPSSGEDQHYERFLAHARALISRNEKAPKPEHPVIASIEELFSAALSRAVRDCESAHPDQRYATLSLQPCKTRMQTSRLSRVRIRSRAVTSPFSNSSPPPGSLPQFCAATI